MNRITWIIWWAFSASVLQAQDMSGGRQLTFLPAREGFPTWSPDGSHLVYQYTDEEDTLGQNGLWKIPVHGGPSHQIFSGIAEHPRWSPDGRYIVFDADTGQNIQLIPAGGGEPLDFLPDSVHIHLGGLPCWSPDGTQIAFKDHQNYLWIYHTGTGKARKIFHSEGWMLLPGCWSADGQSVWITLMDRASRKSTLWKVSSDGKNARQITGHHEYLYRYLALSPDGSMLIYAAKEGDYLGFYVMSPEGGHSIPFALSSFGHNEAPVWSPDGKMLAFSRSRGWNVDIWIMEVDIESIREKLQALTYLSMISSVL